MDSPEDASASYSSSVISDQEKPELVDASVQLDLIEDSQSTSELDSIQGLSNGLTDADMKMPIAIQSCFPLNMQLSSELLVISNNGNDFLNDQKLPFAPLQAIDSNDAVGKRLCIEQDGQTYILALPDQLDGLAGVVEVGDNSPPVLDTAQLIASQENIRLPSKQGVNQNWFTSKQDKATLHKKGHVWKQGMWSKEEIQLLEGNIREYCEERDIIHPSTIIFEMSKDERKDFYRTIAKGLNRPLFSVYRRVIRMYDNKNHVGKYTPEELERLKELRSVYGNNWQAIGSAMGRSASSIKDRCRLMKDNCNQGKWLPAEERRLAEAVYELANALPGEMISTGLSWAEVAERVGTRSEKQCRTKWLNYLNWKEAGGTEWTREDDIALIYKIYTLNASDENQVDWNELAKGWMSARSPQWLRGKWWSLKRHVANANSVPFQDVCECLYQQFVLKLQTTNTDGHTCPTSSVSTDNSIPLNSAQLIAQSKPTILHSISGSAPSGIVVTNVSQDGDPPVVSISGTEAVGLDSVGFPSVRVTPIMQTLEVLQPQVQIPTSPQTYLTTVAHTTQPVPLTATLPTSPIIIHTVPADNIQNNETLQVEAPAQVIISPTKPMTSLASTQVPSAPSSPQHVERSSLRGTRQSLLQEDAFETEVSDDSSAHQESAMEGHEGLCKNSPSSHIILADPMLAGSRTPDIMESGKVTEDPLDQGSGTES